MILRLCSVLLTAIALAAALAHLLALPNKIGLPAQDYLTVQQIYRGWALLGTALFGALVCTSVLAMKVRSNRPVLKPVAVTAVCIGVSLILFFAFTFPANQQTHNWTMLPDNWQHLRAQWEYSHAVNAIIYLIALASLTVGLIRESHAG